MNATTPHIEQAKTRLRDEFPGWRIEHTGRQHLPWNARRDPGDAWPGGCRTLEARDPAVLEYLLGQATRLEATVAGRAASTAGNRPGSGISDQELHQLRAESSALAGDSVLRDLQSGTGDTHRDQP